MFDIAFSELVVIGVVGLIVIGPDKLPKVARTLGHLLGRVQRYASDVKSDINRELRLEELQKLQEEIRQNAPYADTAPYKVGQIINHDIKTAAATTHPAVAKTYLDQVDPVAKQGALS
jgi:sec-independent protein translocase protein TatB